MKAFSNYGGITMWALDMVRALNELPERKKLDLRHAMGEYAYREFLGLVDALNQDGYFPFFSYDLKESEYHNVEMNSKWWKDS